MRTQDRIKYLVLAILEEWKTQGDENLPIIKLKDEQIRKALRKLPEAIREEFPTQIAEDLSCEFCVLAFGEWKFIKFDSFSWLLVRADCIRETQIVWTNSVYVASIRTKLPLDEICVMLHVENEIL